MPSSPRRPAGIVSLVACLAVGAAACSGSSESSTPTPTPTTTLTTTAGAGATTALTAGTTTTAAGGSARVTAPVMVDIATADGTVVKARSGQTVILTSDKPTAWTAKVADPTVATFVAGRADASATFNPGLTDLRPGRTTVAVTDGTRTVTFTLEVTAA